MDFRNKKFTKEEIEQYKYSFAGADLSGANFAGLNLTGLNLTGANLTGADLTKANLAEANLTQANLTEAELRRANIVNANLTGANLTEANLREAYLSESNLTQANLTGANLIEADLTGANLRGADLRDANLTYASLIGTNLEGANLEGANLEAADLNKPITGRLIGVPSRLPEEWFLIKGYLAGPGAYLIRANLTEANLTEANLALANLEGANLEGANLTGANLMYAFFTEANLKGANLTEANLTGASIRRADLSGANLTEVISERIIGAPFSLPHGWELIDGCLRLEVRVRDKINLMRKLNKFNVNSEHPSLHSRQLKIKDTLIKDTLKKQEQDDLEQVKCFDLIMHEDYNINDFLLGRTEDDIANPPDETDISRRLVFFVGQDRDNLQPYCYDLENLLNNLNASIYSTDCTIPLRLHKPLFKLFFGHTVYVYLSDIIDVLTTTDKRVFIILPRLIPTLIGDDKQEEIMKTASLDFIGPNATFMAEDHCQDGTNKKVYNIFVCEGRDGDPCFPIEQV